MSCDACCCLQWPGRVGAVGFGVLSEERRLSSIVSASLRVAANCTFVRRERPDFQQHRTLLRPSQSLPDVSPHSPVPWRLAAFASDGSESVVPLHWRAASAMTMRRALVAAAADACRTRDHRNHPSVAVARSSGILRSLPPSGHRSYGSANRRSRTVCPKTGSRMNWRPAVRKPRRQWDETTLRPCRRTKR